MINRFKVMGIFEKDESPHFSAFRELLRMANSYEEQCMREEVHELRSDAYHVTGRERNHVQKIIREQEAERMNVHERSF